MLWHAHEEKRTLYEQYFKYSITSGKRGRKMVNMSFKELNAELTKKELQELENAAASTIRYDEDSPEMKEEMLKLFKQILI